MELTVEQIAMLVWDRLGWTDVVIYIFGAITVISLIYLIYEVKYQRKIINELLYRKQRGLDHNEFDD